MYCTKIGKVDLYYEYENKTIGRMPSSSNLKTYGSDNSLYIGMKKNKELCEILKKIFNLNSIEDFNGKEYSMHSYGGIKVGVSTNINKDGQIQIKINKNGMMRDIYTEFLLEEARDIQPNEIIIIVDFLKMNVRMKNIKDFRL